MTKAAKNTPAKRLLGRITESDDQGKSLSQDLKTPAKTKVKPGFGDRGDQPQKKLSDCKKVAAKKTSSAKSSQKNK